MYINKLFIRHIDISFLVINKLIRSLWNEILITNQRNILEMSTKCDGIVLYIYIYII